MSRKWDRRMIFLLYRRILNLHKGLPQEMRVVGDNYVRDEFKRHKNSNAVEADVFLTEWTHYCLLLASQLSSSGIAKGQLGENLKPEDISTLTDDQIYQLYQLKVETEKPKTDTKNSNF